MQQISVWCYSLIALKNNMEVDVTLFVCIFTRFSEMYIVFERGPRLAIITSIDQRLPPKK